MTVLAGLVAPGFLSSGPVRVALALGGIVSLVSAPVGVLTVVRRQSFAGHALGDIGATGGAGAFLLGVSALWGFLASSAIAVGAFHVAGSRERRSRDIATGIVLGAALGVSALFLYLDANSTSTTGATMTVLFGSLFVVPPARPGSARAPEARRRDGGTAASTHRCAPPPRWSPRRHVPRRGTRPATSPEAAG